MNRLTSVSAVLDALSADLPEEGPGWADVLVRAERLAETNTAEGSTGRRPVRRRVVLALALLAASVVPLVALAAANDWWFFQFRDTPRAVGKPIVVTSGSWSGHAWRLIAYNSKTLGTCWSITFQGSSAAGAGEASGAAPVAVSGADNALGCLGLVGLRPPAGNANGFPTVMYMTGSSFNADYPRWIAGPVVARAKTVVIRYGDGTTLRVPTTRQVQLGKIGWFRGPIRFFAAQLPQGVQPADIGLPQSITGLDARGNETACLVPDTAISYASPLAACK